MHPRPGSEGEYFVTRLDVKHLDPSNTVDLRVADSNASSCAVPAAPLVEYALACLHDSGVAESQEVSSCAKVGCSHTDCFHATLTAWMWGECVCKTSHLIVCATLLQAPSLPAKLPSVVNDVQSSHGSVNSAWKPSAHFKRKEGIRSSSVKVGLMRHVPV